MCDVILWIWYNIISWRYLILRKPIKFPFSQNCCVDHISVIADTKQSVYCENNSFMWKVLQVLYFEKRWWTCEPELDQSVKENIKFLQKDQRCLFNSMIPFQLTFNVAKHPVVPYYINFSHYSCHRKLLCMEYWQKFDTLNSPWWLDQSVMFNVWLHTTESSTIKN